MNISVNAMLYFVENIPPVCTAVLWHIVDKCNVRDMISECEPGAYVMLKLCL